MDTPTLSTGRGSRASTVVVILTLAIAISALTAEARSIWSTAKVTRPATVRIDPYASKGDVPPYWLRSGNGNKPIDRPSMREIEAKKSGR